jgi:hypothetical protein
VSHSRVSFSPQPASPLVLSCMSRPVPTRERHPRLSHRTVMPRSRIG